MRYLPFFISVLCLLALRPLSLQSDDPKGREFMPTDEIQPGMKGFGLTVFAGTEIDTFGVEVLGVLKRVSPKGDIILARLSGGPLEETGIASGMSGSPVYVDGRLIGAAAYGWLYAKTPIAGITPIGEMLDLWTISSEPHRRRKNDGFGFSTPLEEDRTLTQDVPIPEALLGEWRPPPSSSGAFLRQWGAPVAVAGFDDRVVELMAPTFERFGLLPVQGGATLDRTEARRLEPGSMVAAQLIQGDATISVVGTVTYRRGNRVLAFGHPLFRAGGIDLPLSGAVVHTVFPSRQRSFKIASPTQSVGSFKQDRRSGVAGEIGDSSRLIPCDVEIVRTDRPSPERYHYQLVHDRLFTPNLVGWTTANSLLSTERLVGTSSVRVKTVIELRDTLPVTVENFYSGDMAPLAAASDVTVPFSLLMDNPFEEVSIEGITITLWPDEELRTATIEGIRIDRVVVRPGDPIELTILIKPHLAVATSEQITVTIPESTPDGTIRVIAADAKTIKAFEKARAPYNYRPENVEQLIHLLQEREQNNEIVITVYSPIHGITIEGEELPSLPTSLLSVMTSSKEKGESGPTKGMTLFKRRVPTDYFISGSQTLEVRVDRRAQ